MTKCSRQNCNGDVFLHFDPIDGWYEECILCNRRKLIPSMRGAKPVLVMVKSCMGIKEG